MTPATFTMKLALRQIIAGTRKGTFSHHHSVKMSTLGHLADRGLVEQVDGVAEHRVTAKGFELIQADGWDAEVDAQFPIEEGMAVFVRNGLRSDREHAKLTIDAIRARKLAIAEVALLNIRDRMLAAELRVMDLEQPIEGWEDWAPVREYTEREKALLLTAEFGEDTEQDPDPTLIEEGREKFLSTGPSHLRILQRGMTTKVRGHLPGALAAFLHYVGYEFTTENRGQWVIFSAAEVTS